MGVAVMLLVFLLGPTVCAQPSGCSFSYMLEKFAHQIDEFLGGENEIKHYYKMIQNIPAAIEGVIERVTRKKKYMTSNLQDVYVPIVPRRPIILVWPSVMNQAVTKAVEKKLMHREQNKLYLKIECSVNERVSKFEMYEIKNAIDKFDESDRAPKFFRELVPQLIVWLSAEALDCGFFTLFKREEEQISRFIAHNRQPWIKTLQQLVYILIQTIAVIHHKRKAFRGGPVYGPLNWIDQWPESYEHWYKYYQYPNKRLDYFQTFVLNSFDIVMAWLFDHLAISIKSIGYSRPSIPPATEESPNSTSLERDTAVYIKNLKRYTYDLWKYTYRNQWNLSEDSDIVCAMESYYKGVGVNYFEIMETFMLHYYKNMTAVIMEAFFVECTVKGECKGQDEVDITIGENDSDTLIKTPSTSCVFTCKEILENPGYDSPPRKARKAIIPRENPFYIIPRENREFEYNAYQAYKHAHMTTAVAHELYCSHTNLIKVNGNVEVTQQCYPLIVEKYIMEHRYKLCKTYNCEICKSAIVTMSMPEPEYKVIRKTKLKMDMTIFPDLNE